MQCRVCSTEISSFASFGKMPLGNAFVTPDGFSDEQRFDLKLAFCPNCTLVQQMSPPPKESLERDYTNYRYVPVGPKLRGNLEALGRDIVSRFKINPRSLVVDIGSNDGTLLAAVRAASRNEDGEECRVLGIEPATEISHIARQQGVETISEFFSHPVAERIITRYGLADVVVMTQTLQHLEDPMKVMSDISHMLKPNGILVVEGRYWADILALATFDAIYPEMIYCYTLHSLTHLADEVMMTPFHAERVDVYGGSLRVYIRKVMNPEMRTQITVPNVMREEATLGVSAIDKHHIFAERVKTITRAIAFATSNYKGHLKKKVAGYGAPSTSTTLLMTTGLNSDYIDYIVDDNPMKQGLYTPGSHIPIFAPAKLETYTPDLLVLLAWRLKDEILPKVKKYMDKGMKVLIPLPEVQVI